MDVLGTPLQCTTYDALIEFCRARAAEPGAFAIDFTNTQIVTLRRHDPFFRELTSRVGAFIPDGMPLVWILNRRGAGLRDRVYGPTFFRRCVAGTPAPIRHYFLGGSQHCLDRLIANMKALNPGLLVAGARNGYFGPADEQGILEEINRADPDFIWVGLGTPKQQDWIHRHLPQIRRGIVFAVGFAFDVNAGTKKDAPGWMQRLGLTWFFRLLTEPLRLGPRYLKYNTLFLWYLLRG